MINQYIENLLSETRNDNENLQAQLEKLVEELKYSQEKRDKLQRERNKDINIFSPRTMSLYMDDKLEKAKEEVESINQQIEYIREKIEANTKKKLEYEGLLAELEEKEVEQVVTEQVKSPDEVKEEVAVEKGKTDNAAETLKSSMNAYFGHFIEVQEAENADLQAEAEFESLENSKNPEKKGEEFKEVQENVDLSQLKDFLKKIYKTTEVCLACTNDKNRCKNELKKLKTEIKKYAEEIEKN